MTNSPVSPSPQGGGTAPAGRVRVAVVFGGRSSEHGVSVVTAGSVLAAIDRSKYEVLPIGIATDGRWLPAADEPARMAIADGRMPDVERVSDVNGGAVVLPASSATREVTLHEAGSVPKALGDVDVVLPLLHGPFGEDGTLQGLLEMAGLPYVGAGVLASAVAMDKEFMKRLFTTAGLEVGPYTVIKAREWESEAGAGAARKRVEELGWPVFVKPARAGSSAGITKVHGPDELDAAVEEARRHDPKVIVEAMVTGREIECGVLEFDDGPRASLPAEIPPADDHEFYDFEAKYIEGPEGIVPAPLTAEQTAEVRELAVRAFDAVDCEGLVRADFFLADDGRWIINEINTMPGFTPTSMYPRMWAETGVPYAELIDRLIAAALRRPTGLR